MVTKESVEAQLKKIHFNTFGWGRTEIRELPNIILPDEQIFECANGIYEGGFALLVATDVRVLLIDKKPMNYLTVEDLRFDMISEIDYSHRLLGARISISTGSKNLRFTSYNQARLRKLIGHIQHCMAEIKKRQADHQEDQKLHLEQINRQLQTYLLAQHQQQQKLQQQLQNDGATSPTIEPVRPSPQLADYLFAQSLLAQHETQTGQDVSTPAGAAALAQARASGGAAPAAPRFTVPSSQPAPDDLYAEGVREVFGRRQPPTRSLQHVPDLNNPLRIAYSKLPMAMRNRKFGRPSFHAHSQQTELDTAEDDMLASSSPPEVMPAHY